MHGRGSCMLRSTSMAPARSDSAKGTLLIFLETLLWSLFPVFSILSFSSVPPLFSAGITILISSLFFALLLTIKRKWHEVTIRAAWGDIVLSTLFIGIMFYGLVYIGMEHTTAGNTSIMSLMEIFFSFLILGVILKHEEISLPHALGSLCMVAGTLLILMPKASGWHSGDLIVVAATAFAPIGNRYSQRARRRVSAETILFFRSVISGSFLLLLACFLEQSSLSRILSSGWYLLANGLLLMGLSKILWIEGINLIPITKAISLETLAPFLTLLFAFLFLREDVELVQIAGLVPMVVGVSLLTRKPLQQRLAP